MYVCEKFYINASVWEECEICFEQVEALAAWETRSFDCGHMIHGRYVLVRLNMKGILTLCKVRIFGSTIRGKDPDGIYNFHLEHSNFKFTIQINSCLTLWKVCINIDYETSMIVTCILGSLRFNSTFSI